jgi:hypothetical protein
MDESVKQFFKRSHLVVNALHSSLRGNVDWEKYVGGQAGHHCRWSSAGCPAKAPS